MSLRRAAAATREEGESNFYPQDDERGEAPGRRREDSLLAEIERTAATESGRKRLDALRAEVQLNSLPEDETGMFAVEGRLGWLRKPSRLLLLILAIFAGGTAAYLATHREAPVVAVSAPAQEAAIAALPAVTMTKVLVATQAIGMGERLTPASVAWQDWPEAALRPEYITDAATPEAITDMTGTMARFELFPGEPVREEKLVRTDQGYLSAVLAPGMRGVSVAVTADSASGGFVVPNDHVDVILTRMLDTGQDSETILTNVKVLAIDKRLGETGATGASADAAADPQEQMFANQAIATLALDATQAEVIVNAAQMGKLSLVLRSMEDALLPASVAHGAANQAIRISSPFWRN